MGQGLLIVTSKCFVEEWAEYIRNLPEPRLFLYTETLAKRRKFGAYNLAQYDVVITTFDVRACGTINDDSLFFHLFPFFFSSKIVSCLFLYGVFFVFLLLHDFGVLAVCFFVGFLVITYNSFLIYEILMPVFLFPFLYLSIFLYYPLSPSFSISLSVSLSLLLSLSLFLSLSLSLSLSLYLSQSLSCIDYFLSSDNKFLNFTFMSCQIVRSKEVCVPEEASSEEEDSSDIISDNSDTSDKENDLFNIDGNSSASRTFSTGNTRVNGERDKKKRNHFTEENNEEGAKEQKVSVKKGAERQKKIPWMASRTNNVLIEYVY